jgi:hypothetical protein
MKINPKTLIFHSGCSFFSKFFHRYAGILLLGFLSKDLLVLVVRLLD